MKQFFLQVPSESLEMITEKTANKDSVFSSIWFWTTAAEFLLIVFLLIRLKRSKSDLAFSALPKDKIKQAGTAEIDMDDLMNSINGSRELYKELSRVCHPDRFVDTDKQILAEEIFQEISTNKRNFKSLTALKERAKNELNITF